MKYEKRRREVFLQENLTKRKHNPSRQSVQPKSVNNQQVLTPLVSLNASDDEERLFRVRIKKKLYSYLSFLLRRLKKVYLPLDNKSIQIILNKHRYNSVN